MDVAERNKPAQKRGQRAPQNGMQARAVSLCLNVNDLISMSRAAKLL